MTESNEKMQRMLTLLYYNRVLRDRGVITQQEYLRLAHLIQKRYPERAK